jgi:hypothetical protein
LISEKTEAAKIKTLTTMLTPLRTLFGVNDPSHFATVVLVAGAEVRGTDWLVSTGMGASDICFDVNAKCKIEKVK